MCLCSLRGRPTRLQLTQLSSSSVSPRAWGREGSPQAQAPLSPTSCFLLNRPGAANQDPGASALPQDWFISTGAWPVVPKGPWVGWGGKEGVVSAGPRPLSQVPVLSAGRPLWEETTLTHLTLQKKIRGVGYLLGNWRKWGFLRLSLERMGELVRLFIQACPQHLFCTY